MRTWPVRRRGPTGAGRPLGHSTTAVTTDTYQHVLPDSDHDAACRVAARLPRSCSAKDRAGDGVKVRDVVRILEREGWQLLFGRKAPTASFATPNMPGTVTVPGNPGSELKPGTLVSVLKQAGITGLRRG